jgi:hypothetical protein
MNHYLMEISLILNFFMRIVGFYLVDLFGIYVLILNYDVLSENCIRKHYVITRFLIKQCEVLWICMLKAV